MVVDPLAYGPRIRMRLADPDQAPDIVAFYKSLREPDLLPRPEPDYKRAAEAGRLFVAMDGNAIVGASGVFALPPSLAFSEAGATGIAKNFRGYKLQRLFGLVRIAAVVAIDTPSMGIVTAIKPNNTASNKNMASLGFRAWATPIPEMTDPCVACASKPSVGSGRLCCCDFLELPAFSRHQAVKEFLRTVSKRSQTVLLPKANSTMFVTMDVALADPPFRLELEDYAAGSP